MACNIHAVISRMTNNTTVINYNINYLKSVMYIPTRYTLITYYFISYLYANSYDLLFNNIHNLTLYCY